MAKIVTNYDPKPIPTNAFDWTAWREGTEGEGPEGHGATEAAAIKDLEECFPDEETGMTSRVLEFKEALAISLCEAWGNKPNDLVFRGAEKLTYFERECRVVEKILPLMKSKGFDIHSIIFPSPTRETE